MTFEKSHSFVIREGDDLRTSLAKKGWSMQKQTEFVVVMRLSCQRYCREGATKQTMEGTNCLSFGSKTSVLDVLQSILETKKFFQS